LKIKQSPHKGLKIQYFLKREGKGENIWRRNKYFLQRKRKTEKKKEEIFGERKIIFLAKQSNFRLKRVDIS